MANVDCVVLQAAGIPKKYAPTIGIAVDPRRVNLSEESLKANVERLKAYQARLIVFPRRVGQHKKTDSSKEEVDAHKEEGKIVRSTHSVLPIVNVAREKAIAEIKKGDMGEGESAAYWKLRDARSDARLVGVREKRAKAKADDATAAKK